MFDWIHGACAFGPELPLCFVFYSLQGWCIVQGLDANWHKFQCCMTRVVQILARKAVPSETGDDRCVFVCVRDFTHTPIYLALFTRPKAVMQNTCIHTCSRRRFGTAIPRKTANRQFSSFFRTKTALQIGRKRPAIRTKTRKRAQIRISALMCFDKMYFIGAFLGLNFKLF